MIACKTLISKGAGPKEGDPHSHGYTLFDDQIKAAREAMGWDAAPFTVPDDIAKAWKSVGRRAARRSARPGRANSRPRAYASDFTRAMKGELPANAFGRWTPTSPRPWRPSRSTPPAFTRARPWITWSRDPEMIGGSADPDRLEQHPGQGHGGAFDTPDYKVATSTMASASSAWRGHERHVAARRRDPYSRAPSWPSPTTAARPSAWAR